MTYPTHKQYAIGFAFIATMLIYWIEVSQINYYMTLGIMLLTAKYGGLFPDIDHSWQNVKEKTVPNYIINKIIHATGGKHRSWQTHSIDIVVLVTALSYIMPKILLDRGIIDNVNKEVMYIILLGFSAGWISHLVADMMTSAGVRLLCWRKQTIRLVPKKIGSFKFNTGHEWESFVYRLTRIINIIKGAVSIIYPYFPYLKNAIMGAI